MTYLLIITLAPSPTPSQIPHTIFDIISLSVDAVLCHDQDTLRKHAVNFPLRENAAQEVEDSERKTMFILTQRPETNTEQPVPRN